MFSPLFFESSTFSHHLFFHLSKTVKVGYSLLSSFLDFGAGLTVGMSGLAAGFAIGVAGDIGVRSYAQQQKMYVPMVLILIFSEALGLYGTIVSILLITGGGSSKDLCVEA